MSKPVSNKFQIVDAEPSAPYLVARSADPGLVYQFGPYRLDTAERVLSRDGLPVPVTAKAFDLLLLLIENRGRLVTKDRLMETIWPDAYVEEKTLAQNVFTLRKILAPDPSGQHYIETVPKYGYRFRAEVEMVAPPRQEDNGAMAEPGLNATAPAADVAPGMVARPVRRRIGGKLIVAASLVAAVVIIGSAMAAKFFIAGRGGLARHAFQTFNISRLTHSGNITSVGLSPDGKFVAYAARQGDHEGLFVRQLETGTTLQIVRPAQMTFRGITFAPTGGWVYYVTSEREEFTGALYRVSMLGGAPQRVSSQHVDSRIAFAPDGKRFAFVRWTDVSHTSLLIANSDGTGEQQLAIRDSGDHFSTAGPAWSPDGKMILIATESFNITKTSHAQLLTVDTENGSMQTLPAGNWNWIGQTSWLVDGSGLVFTAWNAEGAAMSDQIWTMTYPGHELRRVTNDINGYLGVDISADARTMVATDSSPAMNFWVAANGDWTQAVKITNGGGELYNERAGLAWTPDGRIVYSSRQSGNQDLWTMEADGSRPKPLTFESANDMQPAVSPDGRYVVFVSNRTGKEQLWRIDAQGGNAKLLANTEGVRSPSITGDGLSVVYLGNVPNDPTIWRVPIDGGVPIQISKDRSLLPAVSPDRQVIACLVPDPTTRFAKLTLRSFTDGKVIRQFDTPIPKSTPALRWSPDGRSVAYVVSAQGVSNIWSQPLDGSSPEALTAWNADLIYRFDWSRDGRLLTERGTTLTDVILIRDGLSAK